MAQLLGTLLDAVRALCLATVSAGAVTLIPARDADPSSALEAADRLLYEVKRGGRNHAIHADLTSGNRRRIESAHRVADETVA